MRLQNYMRLIEIYGTNNPEDDIYKNIEDISNSNNINKLKKKAVTNTG